MRIFIAKSILMVSVFMLLVVRRMCCLFISKEEMAEILADFAVQASGFQVFRREDDAPDEDDSDDDAANDAEEEEFDRDALKTLFARMQKDQRENLLADTIEAEIKVIDEIRARTELIKSIMSEIAIEESARG